VQFGIVFAFDSDKVQQYRNSVIALEFGVPMTKSLYYNTGQELLGKWDMQPVDLVYVMLFHNLTVIDSIGFKLSGMKVGFAYLEKGEYDFIAAEMFLKADTERLHDRFKAAIPERSDLIYGSQLMDRWNRNEFNLWFHINNDGLKVVDRFGQVVPDSILLEHIYGPYLEKISELFFLMKDVVKFEKVYTELNSHTTEPAKKLRPSQQHKQNCREVAKALWDENPEITIADMVLRDEITQACDGKLYAEKTIRDWIKDLCPNRSPGRRPKKKLPTPA
jgi:hypothetical protein